MGWKCALQIKGLTIGEPSPTAKHRMPLKKAAMEAGYERASKSATLDRRRSKFNIYDGYESGKECAEAMTEGSALTTVKLKDGAITQRKTRSDAVVGWAVITNPPAEACRGWDDDTYRRFYQDAWECLKAIKPNIFRDENVTMTAEHWDEGTPPEDVPSTFTPESLDKLLEDIERHQHRIGYARDENGRWCGNEIDSKFLHDLNKVFPTMMRERGWDMDDLDVTDYERTKIDRKYKAERAAKRRKSGRDVNAYLADTLRDKVQEADAALDDAVAMTEVADEIKAEAEALKAEASQTIEQARTEADAIRSGAIATAAQKVNDGLAEYRKKIKKAETDIAEKQEAEKRLEEARKKKLDEDRQAYIEMLFEERNRVHSLIGSEDTLPKSYESIQELQDAVHAEYQQWEDQIEQQKRLYDGGYDAGLKAGQSQYDMVIAEAKTAKAASEKKEIEAGEKIRIAEAAKVAYDKASSLITTFIERMKSMKWNTRTGETVYDHVVQAGVSVPRIDRGDEVIQKFEEITRKQSGEVELQ